MRNGKWKEVPVRADRVLSDEEKMRRMSNEDFSKLEKVREMFWEGRGVSSHNVDCGGYEYE